MAKTLFERTERELNKVLKGQAALVMEALDGAEGPSTVEALTATIKDLGLVTRQDPERITSYYLCIFKKAGLVRAVQVEDRAENISEADVTAETEIAEELVTVE
jgi:hypothetical protein